LSTIEWLANDPAVMDSCPERKRPIARRGTQTPVVVDVQTST
jgi:hypothetical protein